MKILYTVHVYMPKWTFGTEKYTHGVAKWFQSRGHEVMVVTCESNVQGDSPEVSATQDLWEGVPVHRLTFNNLLGEDPARADYYNPYVDKYLRSLLEKEKPDLVHVCHAGHLSTAVFTAPQALGIPVVSTLTDFWLICPTSQLLRYDQKLCAGPSSPSRCVRCYAYQRGLGGKYRGAIESIPTGILDVAVRATGPLPAAPDRHLALVRAIARRSDWMNQVMRMAEVFFSPSDFLRRMFVANGMEAERIRWSPHSIDPSWTKDLPPRQRTGDLRFAYIGMIAPHKGVHVLLEAFRGLPQTRGATLTLYGDTEAYGSYWRQLEPLVQADPDIRYGGKFAHDRLPQVLSGVDVLVLPSTWYENTPTIMYEAFAAGIPVIASDIGGMAELISTYRGGWTFPVGDSVALRSRIQSLVGNANLVVEAGACILPVPTIADHCTDLAEAYVQSVEKRTIEVT